MIATRSGRGVLLSLLACAATLVAAAQEPGTHTSGRPWLGRAPEIETHLRTADIDRMEDTSVGVTRPRHVFLKSDGPFAEMLWKPLAPGQYRGYFESYRSEIAAYEIDKLLELNMVPPAVERTIGGETGAAVMWISGTRTFKELGGVPRPPARYLASWNRQLVRAKMYDNLIGNEDPNLGNWLVDSDWEVILIDHSRSFRTNGRLTHELTRVDKELWNRFATLTERDLAASAAGKWLETKQQRAIIERRDAMKSIVERLVKRDPAGAYVP